MVKEGKAERSKAFLLRVDFNNRFHNILSGKTVDLGFLLYGQKSHSFPIFLHSLRVRLSTNQVWNGSNRSCHSTLREKSRPHHYYLDRFADRSKSLMFRHRQTSQGISIIAERKGFGRFPSRARLTPSTKTPNFIRVARSLLFRPAFHQKKRKNFVAPLGSL